MEREPTFDEFAAQIPVAEETETELSRRKFLTGAVAGGATGLVAAAGTGVAVWKVSDAELLAAKEAAEAQLAAVSKAKDDDLARLQGLLKLYERLEKVGLDAILKTGMLAVSLPFGAVEVGAKALGSGLDWSEEAILALVEALPTAQDAIQWLEDRISALATGIERVETAVARALDRATDNAVGRGLKEFTSMVLDHLPFGLGEKLRAVFDSFVALITQVDDMVAGINTTVLEPLGEQWFSTREGQGIKARFVTPLVENVMDPLEAHLVNLAVLADNWQNELAAPIEQALDDRSALRAEIARYKQDHGLN